MGGKKLPKYEPKFFQDPSDYKDSPAKSQDGEHELRVYDDDQDGSKIIESSSNLHTDPSMRDYDFHYEPEQISSNIFGIEKIGGGLGVGDQKMGQVMGRVREYDMGDSA